MHLGRKAGPVIAEARLNAQAATQLARLDAAPVADPFWELSRLAGQAVAWKDSMAERVNALSSLRYESRSGLEQLRSEIALWERALDRCLLALTAMSKLDIDSRLVGIREATANMLEAALDAALTASGLDLEGQMFARAAFRRNIHIVAVQQANEPKALPAADDDA